MTIQWIALGAFFLTVLLAFLAGKRKGHSDAIEVEEFIRTHARSRIWVRYARVPGGDWVIYAGRRDGDIEGIPDGDPVWQLQGSTLFKTYEGAKRAALFYFPGHRVDPGGTDPEEES